MSKAATVRDDNSAVAAVSSASDYLALPFEQRYEAASQAFPDWLLSDPISFPRDHPTYGWGCRVTDCNAELANSNIKFLCNAHDHEYRLVSSTLSIEQFAKQAKPCPCKYNDWGRSRREDCRVCGPNREALIRGLCAAHDALLRKARKSGDDEKAWLSAQAPFAAHPRCSVLHCVHDGVLFNFRGEGEAKICRSHYEVWKLYKREHDCAGDPKAWTEWVTREAKTRRMQPLDVRGLVTLNHLPYRLQCEIRYAIHRHANTIRRTHWRPRHIQLIVDVLANAGVQTLNDPMVAEQAPNYKTLEIRRIWTDLPIAARSLTLTKQDAKEGGWFDPLIVGAAPFQGAQVTRRKVWDLTDISQRWLRDLLWDHLESLATETKRLSVGNVLRRIRGIGLLSKALRQLREDEGNNPELLNASDARAFKELWDLWHREQIPVVENKVSNPPTLGTLSDLLYRTHPSAMRIVLLFGCQTGLRGPSDSFVLAFPQYSAPQEAPKPRPINDADFRLLISEASLEQLEAKDVNNIGLSDIWFTHAYQGGRIGETLALRLGCIAMIGDAQPYLWRDISKVNVLDYGMPCHYPVYQRLLRRQEITRAKLRARYAKELASLNKRQRAALEAVWDRTMPLFPSTTKNPDLRLPLSQCYFREKFDTWIGELGLTGITTHRTRATLATALLNNGAPAALVRQMLGHFSEESLAHYARYSDDNVVRHLHQVWTAGPGMDKPGKVLMTPATASGLGSAAAVADRIDLTVIPVEHGLCRYGPVVGGSACPVGKNCSGGPKGPCPHFVLTGADLAYWERKRDAAYHFAEGAPSEEARDYILNEWKPWEKVLAGLRDALDELGLLEAAERLDLRSPMQDFFHPLFSSGWPLNTLPGTSSTTDHPEDVAK
ncbi:site-specific integrase [Mycolicibacterium agri]|uniref:Tyr recombinase domain-containing protein n=1 Tax=Mycolicibacterium agri TaxID=36811 RepID=A0A7I9W2G3_MYCAG|nr:site-specific integrase [Mycolicibacterium agri]GFG51884.1 hypothetical protein MAGR_33250 [Mycolicibacterium agri]